MVQGREIKVKEECVGVSTDQLTLFGDSRFKVNPEEEDIN